MKKPYSLIGILAVFLMISCNRGGDDSGEFRLSYDPPPVDPVSQRVLPDEHREMVQGFTGTAISHIKSRNNRPWGCVQFENFSNRDEFLDDLDTLPNYVLHFPLINNFNIPDFKYKSHYVQGDFVEMTGASTGGITDYQVFAFVNTRPYIGTPKNPQTDPNPPLGTLLPAVEKAPDGLDVQYAGMFDKKMKFPSILVNSSSLPTAMSPELAYALAYMEYEVPVLLPVVYEGAAGDRKPYYLDRNFAKGETVNFDLLFYYWENGPDPNPQLPRSGWYAAAVNLR